MVDELQNQSANVYERSSSNNASLNERCGLGMCKRVHGRVPSAERYGICRGCECACSRACCLSFPYGLPLSDRRSWYVRRRDIWDVLALFQSRLGVSRGTHGAMSCSILMRWSFAGVGDCKAPNFLSEMSTTLRESSWSWSMWEAMLWRGTSGGGHRWELESSGSCLWRAIVRMEGDSSTVQVQPVGDATQLRSAVRIIW